MSRVRFQDPDDEVGVEALWALAPWREDVPNPAHLSARRAEELRADRGRLLAAVATLETSRRPVDICANLPTVLTLANGVVHGLDGQWDHRLAATCRDWIGIRSSDPGQLADARDEVAAAALPIALQVDDWVARGDALAIVAEGAIALRHLARRRDLRPPGQRCALGGRVGRGRSHVQDGSANRPSGNGSTSPSATRLSSARSRCTGSGQTRSRAVLVAGPNSCAARRATGRAPAGPSRRSAGARRRPGVGGGRRRRATHTGRPSGSACSRAGARCTPARRVPSAPRCSAPPGPGPQAAVSRPGRGHEPSTSEPVQRHRRSAGPTPDARSCPPPAPGARTRTPPPLAPCTSRCPAVPPGPRCRRAPRHRAARTASPHTRAAEAPGADNRACPMPAPPRRRTPWPGRPAWPAPDPGRVHRQHPRHLGLLEHDLAHQDGPRSPRPAAARADPARAAVPAQQRVEESAPTTGRERQHRTHPRMCVAQVPPRVGAVRASARVSVAGTCFIHLVRSHPPCTGGAGSCCSPR